MRRLAEFCYDRRLIVLVGWIGLLIGISAISGAFAGEYRTEFELPASESAQALELLEERGLGERTGFTGQIVFSADQGVNDPAVRSTMEKFFADVAAAVSDVQIVSPYDPAAAYQVAPDGKLAYAELNMANREQEEFIDDAEAIKDLQAGVSQPGLTVELGGDIFAEFSEPSSEAIGILAAMIILLIAFGSVIAMGLPITTALFGIGCGMALIALMTRILAVPEFTPQIAALIGIGVGIDYALLIVTRYRHALDDGLTPRQAVVLAVDTSGRAVVFAGITVVISLLGMFMMNMDFMRSLALGAVAAVLLTMLASVTFLPAVLGFAGREIDRLGLQHIGYRSQFMATYLQRLTSELSPSRGGFYLHNRGTGALVSKRRGLIRDFVGKLVLPLVFFGLGFALGGPIVGVVLLVVYLVLNVLFVLLDEDRRTIWDYIAGTTILSHPAGAGPAEIERLGREYVTARDVHRRRQAAERLEVAGHSFWYKWSRVIQAHPWPALIGSTAILLVLAAPITDLRLGFGDAGNRLETDTTRRAYDLLQEAFGPGFNAPFLIVADMPNGAADAAKVQQVAQALAGADGVASVADPVIIPDAGLAIINVFADSAPQDEETTDLVHLLRSEIIPPVEASTGLEIYASGGPPIIVDFSDYIGERLPWFVGAVLLLSFLLLLVVFHSLIVPIKAVIMNMLSLGASFGAIVAIFQWGYFGSVLGLGKEGPVEAWAPMMLFAIVFGLSMDYEVFLLTRVREEYDRTRDNRRAVADGLAATGRVISAAAAIMICVFGAFILGDDRAIKLIGFGLAFAIFIDATLVRLVLVPAAMELLGDRNWWAPSWLVRYLPTIRVEAEEAPLPAARSAEA